MAATGLQMARMYTYRGCAPSRSAFQSGRLPIHVGTDNDDGLNKPTHGMYVCLFRILYISAL